MTLHHEASALLCCHFIYSIFAIQLINKSDLWSKQVGWNNTALCVHCLGSSILLKEKEKQT